jgi:hypothetical protein
MSKENIFTALANREHENDTKLGMPSTSIEHNIRRLTLIEKLAGGNGWRKPRNELRKFSDGKTRGDRKRALREAANARVSEARDPEFMHSTARARLVASQRRQAA